MSDFDKEAEREKLQEKYGEDGDDEANTRRMSELLLKGATMTNAHCEECNDPLFRHNGQTFCASCQANGQQSPTTQQTQQTDTVDQSDTAQQPDAGQQPETAQQSDAVQQSDGVQQPTNGTQPSDDHSAADQSTLDRQPTHDESQTADHSATREQPSTDPQPRTSNPSPAPSQQPTPQQNVGTNDADAADSTPPRSPGAADLTTARQSLVGTVTRFSQRAAKADDPRRAKELLAAAREAAETLRALEFE